MVKLTLRQDISFWGSFEKLKDGVVRLIKVRLSFLLPVLGLLLCSFFLTGCDPSPSPVRVSGQSSSLQPSSAPYPSQEQQPLKVGVLVPLSGPHQHLGQAFLKAAELALFEEHLPPTRLALVPRDTKGTPQGTIQAFQACEREGVSAFLGPIFSFEVRAIRPFFSPSTKPLLTFSTDTAVLGNGVFTLGFLPTHQVRTVLAVASQEGRRRVAAILPQTPYGIAIEKDLNSLNTQQLASVDIIGRYDPNKLLTPEEASAHLKEPLEVLNSGDFQAVLIPEGGKDLEQILATFRRDGLNADGILFLGTGQWKQAALGSLPYLEQSKMATPESGRAFQRFQQRFLSLYGQKSPRLSSLAYDGVMFLRLLETLPGQLCLENVLRTDTFSGLDGPLMFLSNGENRRKISVITPSEATAG